MDKKKHPRLQRGFGSIRYLGDGRTNPYAVYPPEYSLTDGGYVKYKKALCYVSDWYTGFAVLVSYKAGTYKPGDEAKLARLDQDERELCELATAIMRNYSIITQEGGSRRTLGAVWDEFTDFRFGEHAPKKFSKTLVQTFEFARRNLSPLMSKNIASVKVKEIQRVINDLSDDLSKSSLRSCIMPLKQVLNYAIDQEYIATNYATRVVIPDKARDPESGVAFSREEILIILNLAKMGEPTAVTILIHILSGFRFAAFREPSFKVDIKEGCFVGGVKWGGERIVPIHPYLIPYLPHEMYPDDKSYEYRKFHAFCKKHLPEDHTPHDCRHTFKALCDRYDVSPVAQRALMGHSLGKDIHDSVYSHLDLEDLRREIGKIDICG